MKGEQVVVGTTPTVVAGAATNGVNASSGNISLPTSCLIRFPSGSATVYLGGAHVATGTGCPFVAGEDFAVDLVNEILYGVTATTSATVYIIRRGD